MWSLVVHELFFKLQRLSKILVIILKNTFLYNLELFAKNLTMFFTHIQTIVQRRAVDKCPFDGCEFTAEVLIIIEMQNIQSIWYDFYAVIFAWEYLRHYIDKRNNHD